MRRIRAIKSRESKRRRDAAQTSIRGGCSGGGWPRPSGHASFCGEALWSEAVRKRSTTALDTPTKASEVQAGINTHLSQSTGAGAFDGQQGMSFAISTASDMSGIVCIDMSGDICAMAGQEAGANARPAIKRIASSRRMAKYGFTDLVSHLLTLIKQRSYDSSSIYPH